MSSGWTPCSTWRTARMRSCSNVLWSSLRPSLSRMRESNQITTTKSTYLGSAWYVVPVVEGWLEEQRRDHRRSFQIMHLDAIVKWIVDRRLISELREALAEFAIPLLDDLRVDRLRA